jgi:hypothetical protein
MPESAAALLATLAFWGWVASMSFFALTAFGGSGQINASSARKWGGASLVLFFIWVAALRFA